MTKQGLWATFAFAALLSLPRVASAADKPRLNVEDISSGASPSWAETIVEIAATDPFRGKLALYADAYGKDNERVTRREALTLARGEKKVFRIPVHASGFYRVRLFAEDGALVAEQELSRPGEGEDLVLVTEGTNVPSPTRSNGANDIPRRPREELPAAGMMRLRRGEFPTLSWTYDDVALFVSNAEALRTMPPAACDALVSWVRGGGTLVSLARSGDDTALPCGLSPTTAGNGVVKVIAPPSGDVSPELMDSLYDAAVTRHVDPIDFLDPSSLFLEKRHPQLAWGALLLLLFAGAVPFAFVRLRRRHRIDRIFVVLPLASVAAFGAIVGIGRIYRPARETRTVIARDLASGETNARERRARGFYRPEQGIRVKAANADGMPISLDARHGVYRFGTRGEATLDESGEWILNSRGDIEDLAYFVELGHFAMPGAVTISCTKRDECTVKNDTGAPLRDVSVRLPLGSLYVVPDVERELTFRLDKLAPSERIGALASDMRFGRSHAALTLFATQTLPGDPASSSLTVSCGAPCEVVR